MPADETRLVHEQLAADRIRFVRLQFADILGHVKNISLPVSQCEKAFQEGIWFDGSSIEGFTRVDESDLFLVPDPKTYCPIPWSSGKTREARFICNVTDSQKKPFAGDPRFVLATVLENVRDAGFDFFTGPELEFWLFKSSPVRPRADFHDQGGYFDLCPADSGVDIRRRIILALEKMGYVIEASHHEVSNSQHEISFRYGPALATADRIMTFKYVARTVAMQHGVIASFIAKPKTGINGNAMHVHASLFRDGRNDFFDPDLPDGLSDTARMFIGGLLAHAKGLCRIANPTINSYKRLTPGYEAPSTVSWSMADRSALVRVPAARGMSTRVELRNPDAMCNPYLLLAGILAAGMDGVRQKIMPPAGIGAGADGGPSDMLPRDLQEANACLLADPLLCDTLGSHAIDCLARIAEDECKEFRTAVHPWELRHYFQAA